MPPRSWLNRFRALVALETALPVGGGSLEDAAAVFHFVPVVGLLEGALISGVLLLLSAIHVDLEVVSALYVIMHALITGGIHLDGFADYIDGIASRRRGEELLKVLKDPRKGSFASLWLSIAVLLSYASVSSILRRLKPLSVFVLLSAVYTSSAESMFLTAVYGVDEPYEGMARLFTVKAKRFRGLNIAVYAAIAAVLTIVYLKAVAVLVAVPLIGIVIAADANRRLGFVNGDVLGFSFEAARCSALVINLALLHPP